MKFGTTTMAWASVITFWTEASVSIDDEKNEKDELRIHLQVCLFLLRAAN